MATLAPAVEFVLPPDEPRKRIQSSLAATLEGSERALLHLCGISNFLAVETVRQQERACGRFIASPETAATLKKIFQDLGLACRIAKFKMIELQDRVPGTCHNGAFHFGELPEAKAVLLFGLDISFLEGLEEAEIRGEHRLLGKLFGYPSCCVEAYLAGNQATADRTPEMIPHTGPFPALMNPAVQYLYRGVSMLFHFPCSASCERSRKLALQRLSLLTQMAPEFADLPALGRGITLYGESVGVALVTRYESLDADEFHCQEIVTRDQRIVPFFERAGSARLRLLNPRKFVIGNQVIDAPHQFAARFA